MRLKDKTVLIADLGYFSSLAERLAQDFGKTFYWSPGAESGLPSTNPLLVGRGLPGVERVDSLWEVLNDADPKETLIVFPDVGSGHLQMHLQASGWRVWGSRLGEDLELYRKETKEHMRKLGLPIGKYRTVKGMAALREWLKTHKNQYVKVSRTRGDFESLFCEEYFLVEARLDEIERKLGAKADIMEFVIEDAIKDAVEVARDGFTIDGQFPKWTLAGIEIKGQGYVGRFVEQTQLPQALQETDRRLSGTLREYQYRNWFAVEERITRDGTGWIIDPCCRFGSPPGELVQEMYTNLADILWHGAEGILVEPKPLARWGAELVIRSEWAMKNWQALRIPEKYRRNIKLRHHTRIQGKTYVVPQLFELDNIGGVIGWGKTKKDAIEMCCEAAGAIKGYGIETDPSCLNKTDEEFGRLREFGISL